MICMINEVYEVLEQFLKTIPGHYAYVDGSAGTFGLRATLQGPLLQPSPSTCQIQFYYHMLGAGKLYCNDF